MVTKRRASDVLSLEDRVMKLELMQEMSIGQTAKLEIAVKEHMIQEELDRKEIIAKLSTIELARSGDKKFIGGIVFITSCLWAALSTGLVLFKFWRG